MKKNIKKKIKEDSKEEKPKILVIGDPHFGHTSTDLLNGKEFAEKSLKIAKNKKPDFIVILGDTIGEHEKVNVYTHNMATEWIDNLSEISHVFLLIGNHDLANPRDFLTNRHIFNPLKKWPNVTVVDSPIVKEYKGYSFVFCPYVEPGRFEEALNVLIEQGEMWEMADCIFSHQEFRGCDKGNSSNVYISENGDVWNKKFPPVINGHIHKQQIIGNIYMPGSPYQHNFGEDTNKCLWFLTFKEEEKNGFSIEKLSLGIKEKKTVSIDIGEIDKFDVELAKKYYIKLDLYGNSEQFKIFRLGKKYSSLRKMGIKFSYNKISETDNVELFMGEKSKLNQISYMEMLKKVVDTKNNLVKEMYEEIMGEKAQKDENTICKLVFVEDSDDYISLEFSE